jgi:glycosyltransferase involved in cell wall biosynthesis
LIEFSVVIPVRDAAPWLPELWQAVTRLDPPDGDYEVVFVDDGSVDGGYEYLVAQVAADHGRCRVIRGPGRGPAGARNLGIAAASGRFIAFADADTVPQRDWLRAASAALTASTAQALEGAVLPWTGSEPDQLVRRVSNEDGGRYMTANMVYARTLLDRLGGFDERFGLPHYLEDADLAFRAKDLGVVIPFVREARVRHRDRPMPARELLRDQAKLQWIPLLASKHPSRYRTELRTKVETLRPGDVDLFVALLLMITSARRSRLGAVAAGVSLGLALRRVLATAQIRRVKHHRALWLGASLLAPFLRLVNLARGWARYKTFAI